MVAKYYASARSANALADWPSPLGVVHGDFDRVTHQLATPLTPSSLRYTEYFVEGTEPEPLRADLWKLFSAGPIIF
jgi:hypothetical protein